MRHWSKPFLGGWAHLLSTAALALLLGQSGQVVGQVPPGSASDVAAWRWYPARGLGEADVSQVPECSGMAASRRYPGRLYAINDHGNPAMVHALDTLGNYVGAFTRPNLVLQDCEEVALLAGPTRDTLLVADIGDNRYADLAIRPYVRLYRLPEPEWLNGPQDGQLDSLRFTFADGPHDCEALLPDPATGEILLITKRDVPSRLYRLKPDWNAGVRIQRATYVCELPMTWAVGASLRPTEVPGGRVAVIRTLRRLYLYPVWSTVLEALRKKPIVMDAAPERLEPQGESITWSADGESLYSLSEESNARPRPVLVRIERKR